MKAIALLAFFFFLVALFASTRAETVRDTEGHPVTDGGTYYIIPQDIEDAAIVTAVISPDKLCKLAVVENSRQGKGNAASIETALLGSFNITTDDPLWIYFDYLPSNPCTKEPFWLVVQDDDFKEKAVMVGSKRDYPKRLFGLFYFKTNDIGLYLYNIFFRFEDGSWGVVIIKTDNDGNRRLVVRDLTHLPTSLIIRLEKRWPSNVASHLSMVA